MKKKTEDNKIILASYLLSALLSFYSYFLFIPILRLSFSGDISAFKISNLVLTILIATQLYFPNQEYKDTNLSANQIDIILRYLNENMKTIYIDYAQNKYSIIIEHIILSHQLNCGNQRDCFCSNIKQNQKEDLRYQFLGDELRKKYIQDFTINLYKQKIKDEKEVFSQVKYGYYSYLLDVVSNEKYIQLELIKLNNCKQLSNTSKGKQIFQILNYLALQKSFTTNKINLRVNQLNKNSQFLQIKEFTLYDIIIFDELLISALKEFFYCLQLKVEVILTIGKDIVDLNQLYDICKKFQIQNKKLFEMISNLAKQNNFNPNLKHLCDQYFYVISSDEKLNLKIKSQKNSISEEIIRILNEQDSCAVYISLLQKENQIVKVSQNFEKIFTNYSNSSIIGKTLNFILPKRFQDPHQNMLKGYSERTSFTKNLKKHLMQLGVDQQGYAVPYQLKLQNHQIGNDDIGLCGQIKKLNSNNRYYISLFYNEESKNYEILTVSQNFYQAILSKGHFSNQELHTINPISIMPILQFYLKSQESYLNYESIVVESVNEVYKKQKKNISFFENKDYDKKAIYFGVINQYRYQNKYVCMIQIEIENMQLILSNQLKQEVLEAFQKEFEQLEDAIQEQSSTSLDEIYRNCIQLKDKHFSQRIFQTNKLLQESQLDFQKYYTQINQQNNLNLDISKQQQINQHSFKNTSPSIQELIEVDQITSQKRAQNIEQNFIQITSPQFSSDKTFQLLQKQNNNIESDGTPQNYTSRHEFKINPSYLQQKSLEINQENYRIKNIYYQQVSTSRGILSDNKFDNNYRNNYIQENLTDASADKFAIPNQNFTNVAQIQLKTIQQNERIVKKQVQQSQQQQLDFDNINENHKMNLFELKNRQTLQKIKSKNPTRRYFILNILGIVLFFTVQILYLANFVGFYNFFKDYKSLFDKSSWNSSLRIQFDSVFSNYFFYYLLNNNIFSLNQNQKKSDLIQTIDQLNNKFLQTINYDLNQLMNQNLVNEFQKNLILNAKEIIYFQNENQNNNINTYLGYNLIDLFGDLSSNRQKYYFDQQSLTELYDNFGKVRQSLIEINSITKNLFSSDLNEKLSQNLCQLVYMLVVSVLLIMFIAITYLYIQFKREKTIFLLTTFHPEQLRKMISKIQISVQSFHQQLRNSTFKLKNNQSTEKNAFKLNLEFLSFKTSLDHIQNKIQKKRSFSDVVNLKKIRFSLISLLITAFLLLQFYSISVYFYFKLQSQNLQDNSTFQGILNDSQYEMKYLEQLQYVSISAKFLPQIFNRDTSNYITINQNTFQIQNSQILNKLLEYQNNFSSQSNQKQKIYQNYLIKILESDACVAIFKYPQYFTENFQISQQDCIQENNGIFQQGLITAIKSIFDIEKQIIYERHYNISVALVIIQNILPIIPLTSKLLYQYNNEEPSYFQQSYFQLDKNQSFQLSIEIVNTFINASLILYLAYSVVALKPINKINTIQTVFSFLIQVYPQTFQILFAIQPLNQQHLLLSLCNILISLFNEQICKDIIQQLLNIKEQSQNQHFLQNYEFQKIDQYQLDLVIRHMNSSVSLFQDQYQNSIWSILFEEIVLLHKQSCTNQLYCYCSRSLQFESSQKDEFLGNKLRSKYMNDFFRQMFLNNLGSDQDIPMIKQSFYYFLIDVMSNQTLSLVEILKSKKYCKKSMINLQRIEVAFAYAKTVFNTGEEDKLENISNQTVSILQNLTKNRQQKLISQIKKSKQKVKLIETINFEQQLFDAQKQYLFCLELKKSLLDTISNDHIQLNHLDKQFQELTKQKGFLYNSLYQLVALNYQSIELQNLCIDYESNLTNQNLLFTNFYVQNAKKMALQYRKGLNAFYQFSKDSCVVFVSLLGNLGLVCKVSENFQDVIPVMTNEQAIGRNIGFMMPQEISNVHDIILKNFVQRGLISEGISNYPLLIGVDRNGWTVPYDVKIQVFLVSDQELGASAWIKQVSQDEYEKTLYNTFSGSNHNHAIALDKRFYDILFQDVFQQSEIKSILFGSLAPSLMGILQKADLSREQEILFLKPKTKQDCKKNHINFSSDYSNTKTNVFCQLYQYELFLMRADLVQIKNKFTHFVQMKIKHLSKLQSTLEIKENFRLLAKQLVEYQGIDIQDVESHLNQFFQYHSNFLNQSKSQTILLFTKRDIQNDHPKEDQEESSPPTLAKITENFEQIRSTFLKSNYTQLISQSQIQNQEIITPRNEQARYYEQINSQVSLKLQTPTAGKAISFMNIPMVSSKRENIASQENMILSTNRILTPKENSKLLQYQLASTEMQTSNQISASQEQPIKKLEKKKKKQKTYRYQQSSISSDSTKLSLFQILKRNISRERKDIKTIGLNLISLFLVLCIILMSVLFLILSIQSQQQGLNQSKFMNFSNEINSSIQNLITYKYMSKLTQNNLIQIQPNQSLINQLINMETVQTFQDYQKLINNIIFNSKDTQNTILQQIISSTMTYITEIKSNSKLSQRQNLEVSIVQTYSELINDFYRPPLNNLISYFTENNLNYNNELQKLQQTNQNEIQNLKNQNNYHLMILTTLILAGWFLLIAMYNYNFALFQKRKEETLKLFSTFSPQDLNILIESCNQEIQKTKQQIVNHKQNVLANQQNQKDLNYFKKENMQKELILSSADIQIKKRKNISSTQGLKVYNNYLICYSFLTLILIILTFVLISILQSTTIQQIQDNQKFIQAISQTEQYLSYSLTVTSVSTYCLLGEDEQNINFSNLQAEINNQISQNSSMIQLLIAEINKNNNSNKEFVQNIFENNSCSQMDLISATLQPSIYKIIQQQCNQIENGILQKGLISSLKLYNQKIYSIMQILASPNNEKNQVGDIRVLHFQTIYSIEKNPKIQQQEEIYKIVSFVLQAYEYLFFIPSLRWSILGNVSIEKIISLILSIFLMILIEINDFDFRYSENVDFLAKRRQLLSFLRIFLYVIGHIILQATNNLTLSCIYNGLLHLLKIFYYCFYNQILIAEASQLISIMHCLNISLALSLSLQNIKYDNFDFFICFLSTSPVAVIIGQTVSNITRMQICNLKNQSKNFQQLINVKSNQLIKNKNIKEDFNSDDIDIFLRDINQKIGYLYDEYTNSSQSIFLESIILQHKENCSQPEKCFCSQDSNIAKGGENFLGAEIRKQFITDYTLKLYQSHLNNISKDLDFVDFSYFAYLIDQIKNFRFFYSELIQLKRNKSIQKSLIYMQAVNYLFYYASIQQSKEESANQKLNDSVVQKNKAEVSAKTCLYDIILFDEQLTQTLQLMKDSLLLKANLIQILGNNFVDLNLLYQTSSQLIKQKNILYTQLLQLQAKNECNQELLNICNIFENTLQFSEKLNIFKKKINKFSVINKLSLRGADSCVIFVSLMNNFGNIIRVSKNFQEVITTHANQEVINSNLSIIIPNQIYEIHQQELKHYLQKQENRVNIRNFPLQIGSSKDGWAIPLNIKTQYHQIGEQEIGVSAWIRKQEANSYQYLSLLIDENEKKCSPIVMSQTLFETIFKDIYTQKQIQSINMSLLAPALYAIIEKCDNVVERETYIIKPNSKAQLTNNQLDYNKNQSYFNGIFKYNEIFCVQFQIYRSQSKYINIAQLELHSVTKVEEKQLKYDNLKTLNIQLTKFCNYSSSKQYKTIQFNVKNQLNSVRQDSQESISSNQVQSLQSTPKETNQNTNQKVKNQVYFQQNKELNVASFDQNQSQYEEIQLYNDKEEISLDQNNITSRLLLNQTSILNDLDNMQLLQAMSSTQLELQKGKHSQQQNYQIFTDSIFKNKNSDFNIEQLINHRLLTKQASTEQCSPLAKQTKRKQIQEQTVSNSATNKMITSFKNNTFEKNPAQVKVNEYEQSVSSMKTTNSKAKKEVISSIKSSKRILGLRLLNYSGILALTTIFLIILVNFIDLQNFLQIQKKSFHYLDWNSNIRIALTSVLTNFYINSLININLLKPKDPKTTTYYLQYYLDQMQQQRIFYSNLISQYSRGNKNEIQSFRQIMESNYTYIHVLQGGNYTTKFSLGYTLTMQKSYLDQFRLVPYYYDLMSITTIFVNLYDLDDTLKNIQDNSFDEYSNHMNQILLLQQYNLISISLITLACAISIVPIYQFIQRKREQILRLMTNVSPEKLRHMLGTTSNYLIQIDQELDQKQKQRKMKKNVDIQQKENGKSSKQSNLNLLSNIIIQKKKNISQTSNFAKINFRYLLGSLAFFILLQIYSFSIYILINMYYDNTINNRLFMNQLTEARHFLQIQVGSLYIGFVAKLKPEVLLIQPQPLFEKIKQLQISSQSYLNNIYNYQNNFYGHSRYKQENYNQYIIKVLEKNSCDIIQNNPQYINSEINFDYNQCKKAGDQLLDQGLIQTLKTIFVFNGQITDLFNINNPLEFYQKLQMLDSSDSLIESIQTIQQANIVIQQLNYFLQFMTNELFDYLKDVNLALLISQVSATVIVLFLGWYKFYERIQKSLQKTKQLLEVIDIDVLLENSYIISYFKANK
ncbi:hypothetical protein ABPG72_016097 [Tetrahymena utriculariae]